jgi:competence protein ComEA
MSSLRIRKNLQEASTMKAFYLTMLFVFFMSTATFAAVNINTAAPAELISLAGIGQVKAEAIIKYRKEKGPFKDINELKNVNGIGEKTVEKLKGEITVGETTKTTLANNTTGKKKGKKKQAGTEASSKTSKISKK